MRKFLLFVFLCLLAQVVAAQQMYPVHADSSFTNRLEIDGIGEYGASAMHRELSNTMIWGGFIDEAMKDRSFKSHQGVNRLGMNVNSEIRYIHGRGKLFRDSLTWMVKAGYFLVGNANYTKDIYGLAYYGNSDFLAQQLDFSGSNMKFMRFQKVGFGLVGKKHFSSITLNLVNVQDYADVMIRKGGLYTNEDASQVDLSANGTFRSTYGQQFSKGLGLALDFDFRIPVGFNNWQGYIQLSAQNIGFAHVKGLQRYEADSSWTYSGFEFNSFRDGNNPLGSDFSLLDSLGIQKDTIARSVWLPGYIQAAKMVDPASPKNVQSFFGLRFYPTFNSAPLLFAGAYWKATSFLHASASVSYGGFGKFKAGVYATLNFGPANLMIGTDNVPGLISKSGSGESLVTRLVWKIG